jgi:Uma2 family endonuclease
MPPGAPLIRWQRLLPTSLHRQPVDVNAGNFDTSSALKRCVKIEASPCKRIAGLFVFMQADELISVPEYRSTSYRPDCDYVDGLVEERNAGETEHPALQMAVAGYFYEQRKQWGIYLLPAQRVQVSPTCFRVPDVCVVVGGKPQERILSTPPLICIEILSPDDGLSQVRERLDEYLGFGVPYVWLLDPEIRKAYRWTTAGMTEVSEFRTDDPDTLVPLEALFD